MKKVQQGVAVLLSALVVVAVPVVGFGKSRGPIRKRPYPFPVELVGEPVVGISTDWKVWL